MKDLAGVADSPDGFPEIDVATSQHLRETAERAVRTRRGTLLEFPDRYVDLAGFLHAQNASVPAAVVAAGVQEDLEQDERIVAAKVTISAPDADGRTPFRIDVRPVAGLPVVVEGTS